MTGASAARAAFKAAALLLVLAVHLATRLHAASLTPLVGRNFYPRDYEVALSLLAGRGFGGLEVWDDARPEARRIRRFLRQLRDDVDEKAWRSFVSGARAGEPPTLATSRVLEMRVAAGLWRWFGIRWSVLFAFYCLLSTVVAFLVFLIARRLGGGFAAGLLAMLLLAASPFETLWATAAIRDVSPFWFDTVAFAALVLLVPLGRSPAARAGCAFVAGAASTLGIGWRTDGWMVPPLALGALLALLRSERRGGREAALAVIAFVAGVLLFGTARSLAGPSRPLSPQIGFHIAYYGNYDRSNMLGLENSFQVLRNDLYTYQQAAYYALVTRGVPDLTYWVGEYGSVCRDLYLRTLRHNAFDWLWGFPGFFMPALAGLGSPGALQGIDAELLEPSRPAWLRPAYRYLLDPLTRSLPVLFLLGALTLLVAGSRRAEAALLIGFAVIYTAAVLLVLPESKHFGPMLLPLCTVAGAGVWRAAWLASSSGRRLEAVRLVRERVLTRSLAMKAAAVGGALVVLVALVAAMSFLERRGYVREIERLAERGVLAPETILRAGLFSFTIPAGQQPDPRGFLLTIRTGPAPGMLVCWHRRGVGSEPTQRLYLTRHPLAPSRTQQFFVIGLQGGFQADPRTYRCTVTVPAGATIVESRQLDLSAWRRPIYATLFGSADWWPGSPRLPSGVQSTEGFGFPPPGMDELKRALEADDEDARTP
jgi:hypothetical protein